MQILTQSEFLAQYAQGVREFSGVMMQFFDVTGQTFADVSFVDSRLFFCTFRDCTFERVRFTRCTIYFGSFYGGIFGGGCEDCSIELTLFDFVRFSHASLHGCSIRWLGILHSNDAALERSRSTQFKVFTALEQLTPQDIEEAIGETLQGASRLDMSQRMKVRELLQGDMDRHGVSEPRPAAGYGTSSDIRPADGPLTYGEVQGMLEVAFGNYGPGKNYGGQKTPYRGKNTYL